MSGSDRPDSHHPDRPDPAELQCRFSLQRLILKVILAVLTAPYRRAFKLYTWKPLRDFRRAEGNRRELIRMVRDWKVDKYAELQSVQVAASFCAGATLATISWTSIANPVWASDALWFTSLICSIWAVITSIQTRSILDDIPDREQLTQRLPECELKRMKRVILRYKKTPGIGHWIMLFIWQFPSMTMSYAWCTFLTGLTLYVCTPLIRGDKWSENTKVAITYLSVFSVGFFTYLFSCIFVYTSEKAFLNSAASSTRENTDTTDPEYVEVDYESRQSLSHGFQSALSLHHGHQSALSLQHGHQSGASIATRPVTPAPAENKQPAQGLDSIPEHSGTVHRARTLPLPDTTNRRSPPKAPKSERRFLI